MDFVFYGGCSIVVVALVVMIAFPEKLVQSIHYARKALGLLLLAGSSVKRIRKNRWAV
ncbi:MAG: hypothetical protein R3D26_19320 [Cyanobacteriota/Melainabacteria group bacterium]